MPWTKNTTSRLLHRIHKVAYDDSDKFASEPYDLEKSIEYLNFYFMNPIHQGSSMKFFEDLMKGASRQSRDSLLSSLEVLYTLRVSTAAQLENCWSVGEVLEKLSEKQRKHAYQEYDKFVNLLLPLTQSLTTDQLRQLMFVLVRIKIHSHVLWRSLIPRVLSDLESLTLAGYISVMSDTFKVVERYGRKVDIGNHNKYFAHLDEGLLSELLSNVTINKMLLTCKNLAIKPFEMAETDKTIVPPSVDTMMIALNRIMKICIKYSKVGSYNNNLRNNVTDNAAKVMIQHFNQIKEGGVEHLNLLIRTLGLFIMSNRVRDLITRLYQIALKTLLKLDPSSGFVNLDRQLTLIGMCGKIDRELWTQFYREEVLKMIKSPKQHNLPTLNRLMSFMASTSTKDDEIMAVLIDRISDLLPDIESMRKHLDIILRNLHKNISYAILQGVIAGELLARVQKLANLLTAMCICENHKLKLESLPASELPESIKDTHYTNAAGHDCSVKLLNCISCKASQDLVKTLNPNEGVYQEQYFLDNFNEQIVKEAITSHFSQLVVPRVKIIFDPKQLQVCQYKWDGLFYIEGIPRAIGLEITGNAYKADNSELIAKKMIKFRVLDSSGFLPIIFDVSSAMMRYLVRSLDTQSIAVLLVVEMKQTLAKMNIDLELAPETVKLMEVIKKQVHYMKRGFLDHKYQERAWAAGF